MDPNNLLQLCVGISGSFDLLYFKLQHCLASVRMLCWCQSNLQLCQALTLWCQDRSLIFMIYTMILQERLKR